MHFEYFLGETTVRDCFNSIWNCLKGTEMPEKTEDDLVDTAHDFHGRTQFPNYMGNTFD